MFDEIDDMRHARIGFALIGVAGIGLGCVGVVNQIKSYRSTEKQTQALEKIATSLERLSILDTVRFVDGKKL